MVFFQWRALPRFAPALPRNLLHLLCPHFFLLLLFFVPFSVDGEMLRTLIENFFACSSSSSGDSFPSCRTAFLSCVAYQWRSCCEREKERESTAASRSCTPECSAWLCSAWLWSDFPPSFFTSSSFFWRMAELSRRNPHETGEKRLPQKSGIIPEFLAPFCSGRVVGEFLSSSGNSFRQPPAMSNVVFVV